MSQNSSFERKKIRLTNHGLILPLQTEEENEAVFSVNLVFVKKAKRESGLNAIDCQGKLLIVQCEMTISCPGCYRIDELVHKKGVKSRVPRL